MRKELWETNCRALQGVKIIWDITYFEGKNGYEILETSKDVYMDIFSERGILQLCKGNKDIGKIVQNNLHDTGFQGTNIKK